MLLVGGADGGRGGAAGTGGRGGRWGGGAALACGALSAGETEVELLLV